MKTVITFEVGNIYAMNFIGDSGLKPKFICIKKTSKTVTFEKFKGTESITRKIRTYDNVEYIIEGNYSMAPTIYADEIVG